MTTFINKYRPAFNNPNDRLRLFLLQHIDKPTPRHRKELRHLSTIYPDNHLFEKQITDELKTSGFIHAKDLEPDKPQRSETGSKIKHAQEWHTTQSGITALRHSRFPSESKQFTQQTLSRLLSLFTAIATAITAIATVIALFR